MTYYIAKEVILFLTKFSAKPKPEWHPCFRECSSDPTTFKTCGYNFTLEYFWTLSKACYDCPNNTKDCSRIDCIPGDGVKRGIATVNRMMPGPSIRVRRISVYLCKLVSNLIRLILLGRLIIESKGNSNFQCYFQTFYGISS